MLTKKRIVAPAILLLVVLVPACDDHSPTGPSPSRSSGPAPPAPIAEVWNVTARLTSASGGECVGETMQSQMGVPKRYSLAITKVDAKVNVSLRSMSNDYACTFAGGRAESDGFAFGASDGYFTCEIGGEIRGFVCANGMQRNMYALGQNLFGRISGNDISGEWDISWDVTSPGDPSMAAPLETTALYAGTR